MGEIFGFAEIEPVGGIDFDRADVVCTGLLEIQVDDAVALPREFGKQRWPENMHTIESQLPILIPGAIHPFVGIVFQVFPADQQTLLIKEQLPARNPILSQQPGVILRCNELVVLGLEIDITEDIHIVHQHCRCIMEEGKRLDDAAPCIHQGTALVRHIDVRLKVMRLKKLDDLFSKVMDIDDDGIETMLLKILEIALQQGLSSHFDKGFGSVVGQFLKPGSQTGSENHGGSIHGFSVQYGSTSRLQ